MKIRMESLGMKPRTPKRRLSDCSYHGPFGVGVGGESQIKNFTVVSICILKTFWYVISKYRIYLSKYIYIYVYLSISISKSISISVPITVSVSISISISVYLSIYLPIYQFKPINLDLFIYRFRSYSFICIYIYNSNSIY